MSAGRERDADAPDADAPDATDVIEGPIGDAALRDPASDPDMGADLEALPGVDDVTPKDPASVRGSGDERADGRPTGDDGDRLKAGREPRIRAHGRSGRGGSRARHRTRPGLRPLGAADHGDPRRAARLRVAVRGQGPDDGARLGGHAAVRARAGGPADPGPRHHVRQRHLGRAARWESCSRRSARSCCSLVPAQGFVPEGVIRLVMLVGALHRAGRRRRADAQLRTESAGSARGIVVGVLRGYPLTVLLAVLLVFLAGLAVWRKGDSIRRGWTDAHVPIVVTGGAYDQVAGDLDAAVTAAGLEVEPRAAPASMSTPARWLARSRPAEVERPRPGTTRPARWPGPRHPHLPDGPADLGQATAGQPGARGDGQPSDDHRRPPHDQRRGPGDRGPCSRWRGRPPATPMRAARSTMPRRARSPTIDEELATDRDPVRGVGGPLPPASPGGAGPAGRCDGRGERGRRGRRARSGRRGHLPRRRRAACSARARAPSWM